MQNSQYTWRTVQDSKVRSSHADREGKVFSWTDPPEGGHPGEAYNCRCWAEEVNKEDCEKIRRAMDDTYRRHDALHDPILDAVEDIRVTKIILKDLTDEHTAVWKKRAAITFIPGSLTRRPSKRDIAFLELKRRRIAELSNRLEYIKQEIGRKQRMLAEQEKVPEQLEHKRENLRRNAEEFSRRYQACLEKNEKFRK